tara:strand:+ start:2053 stop:3015 length:963 start_codon:yes stop_codon:yes gene_type:complete
LKRTIRANPEFASELVCIIPYVYWLHTQGKLEKVVTSKDMKPFYYFCDKVEEYFDMRTLDNRNSGLEDTPNEWVHHNAESVTGKDYSELTEQQQNDVNGVLDYSEWIPPPYTEKYKTDEFKFEKPVIVVNNNYNIEYGKPITESLRFFDIKTLYDIFSYLTENGYTVVYKRPDNTEFTLDQNEMSTLDSKLTLTADVAGVGIISDYDLCEYFDGNVINMNKMKKDYPHYDYNEFQLKLFSSAEGFVTTNGGGGILCSYFKKPVVMYIPHGKELRANYVTNKDSYLNKLSENNIHPILDEGNLNNYSKVIEKIKTVFKDKK